MPLTSSSNSLLALNHHHILSCDSTNSELIDAIKAGTLRIDEPHLFTAETQSAGRGQRGRSWQSPPGNAYLSLYHPLNIPINGLLSSIIGVALAKIPIIQTLNERLREQDLTPIGVKWANDLGFYNTRVSDKDNTSIHAKDSADIDADDSEQRIIYFKKLAGILIEPVWQAGKLIGVVIGVGLNIKATPKLTAQTLEGMSYQAISLQDICAQASIEDDITLPSLEDIYQQISQALLAAIECFEQITQEKLAIHAMSSQNTDMQTTIIDDFLRQFAAMDALSGLRLQVSQDHNGKSHIVTGDACGIDTNGCLQLRQDNGKLAALFTGRIDVIKRH